MDLILQLVAGLIFIALFVFLVIWAWTLLRAKTPITQIPNSILPDIYKALELKEGSVLYHLGCGDGRVLFYSAEHTPDATYIGIENKFLSLARAHFRLERYSKRTKKNNVTIINGDLSKQDLSKATHIVTYLYPQMMDDMIPQLDEKLAPGTRLVSVAFQFTGKRAIAEIDLNRNIKALARTLYVYEF